PLTTNAYAGTRYRLRVDDVIVDDSLCIPGAELVSVVLCQQRGSYLNPAVGYGLRLDRRNDPIQPTRGFYIDFSQDIAGLGGDVHYVRSETDFGLYRGLTKDFILQFTGTAGYVDGWS